MHSRRTNSKCSKAQAVRLGRDELEPLRIMFELAAGAGQVCLGSCLPLLPEIKLVFGLGFRVSGSLVFRVEG